MVEASSSIMQDAATELEQSGLYRVLRPLPSLQFLDSFCGLSRGLFVDVETTGLDPEADEIIQFAAVEFGFSGAEIVGVRKSILCFGVQF